MFFFLMIRRPPRSTLFPYTTPSDLASVTGAVQAAGHDVLVELQPSEGDAVAAKVLVTGLEVETMSYRSEEHTSELQSRQYLVCRLLLEKKTHPTKRLPRINA